MNTTSTNSKKRIGLVGARGYVGRELLKLLEKDKACGVSFLSSKGAAGKTASEALNATGAYGSLRLEDLSPDDLKTRELDGVILGLSNGHSDAWVKAMPSGVCIVDLSADHRFDDAWVYGLTEKNRDAIRSAKKVANPGCYATAAQLSLAPFSDVTARAQVFGVSGYSGAGNTPSPKNDVTLLNDNLLPYDLIGHTQEKEMARHSGLGNALSFMPHVAPFFRGITVTVSVDLTRSISLAEATERLTAAYEREPLVKVQLESALPPTASQARDKNIVIIGGLTVDEVHQRLVVVAVIDNLLKGAATQALQNLHLMLGVDELSGITP